MKVESRYKELYRVEAPQGRGSYLRLDMNENPEGLPEEFTKAVLETITPSLIAMYPETGTLCRLLADDLGVQAEQIMLTNGSDEALKLIFEVFGCAGKTLVSVSPTFAMYSVYGKMRGMLPAEIPYREDFSVSIQDIIQKIDENTAIVSLLNPNNPIGTVYSVEEVQAIIQRAEHMNSVVIIDEAYHYFYEKSFIELCKKSKNVILLRTFSKLCSIAGLRIGYAVSSPELIRLLFNAKPTYNVNCVALRFAEEIIQRPDLIQQLIATEKAGREYVISWLKEKGIPYYAENGNYVFINCGSNMAKMVQRLKEEGVLVKYYEGHPLLGEYIRISTGSKKIMQIFLDKFEKARNGL